MTRVGVLTHTERGDEEEEEEDGDGDNNDTLLQNDKDVGTARLL